MKNGDSDSSDLSKDGANLVHMNMEENPAQESLGGYFGVYKKAGISHMKVLTPVPELLNDPRFLTLVAAAQLAGSGVGPFWMILLTCLPAVLCILCLCCCCCRRGHKSHSPSKRAEVFGHP